MKLRSGKITSFSSSSQEMGSKLSTLKEPIVKLKNKITKSSDSNLVVEVEINQENSWVSSNRRQSTIMRAIPFVSTFIANVLGVIGEIYTFVENLSAIFWWQQNRIRRRSIWSHAVEKKFKFKLFFQVNVNEF